jgi:hypothetical protein
VSNESGLMSRRKARGRAICLVVVVTTVGVIGVAQPARAEGRADDRITGTGTLLFVGPPSSATANPDGSFVVNDLPVAGTMRLQGDHVTVDATFTGADTLAGIPTRFTVRGRRTYLVTFSRRGDQPDHQVTCVGTASGVSPNAAGGGDFVERLRCGDEDRAVLHVRDVSPILVGGQFAGWNRTVSATLDD